ANTTQFNGVKLLNGNFDYQTTGATNVANVRVNAARLPDNAATSVVIDVAASAQTATLGHTGGTLTDNVTIEVAGNDGTEQLSFTNGTTDTQMMNAINAIKTATGVSASLSGGALRVDSVKYGSDQFVSLKVISGTSFVPSGPKDVGQDAVVNVNGAAA